MKHIEYDLVPGRFSLHGRSSRADWWRALWHVLLVCMVAIAIAVGVFRFLGEGNSIATAAGYMGFVVIGGLGVLGYAGAVMGAVSARRMHDLGSPGGWVVAVFCVAMLTGVLFPVILLIGCAWLGTAQGNYGDNEYGPAPAGTLVEDVPRGTEAS